MSPRRANVLTVLGLVGLLALTSLTAPRWARLLQRPLPAPAEEGAADETTPREGGPAAPASAPRSTINVKLFFQAPDRPGLMIEERAVAQSNDLSRQIKAVVEELIAGSKNGFVPTLPPSTRVLEVFVTARGVAYVNLSKEAADPGRPSPSPAASPASPGVVPSGGSEEELITVYSVVNSLTVNFPAVRRVQILVEDKPRPTLWGHVDLTRPLPPDMTLLATSTLTPVANAAANP